MSPEEIVIKVNSTPELCYLRRSMDFWLKTGAFKNNPQKLTTTKLDGHIPCGLIQVLRYGHDA